MIIYFLLVPKLLLGNGRLSKAPALEILKECGTGASPVLYMVGRMHPTWRPCPPYMPAKRELRLNRRPQAGAWGREQVILIACLLLEKDKL